MAFVPLPRCGLPAPARRASPGCSGRCQRQGGRAKGSVPGKRQQIPSLGGPATRPSWAPRCPQGTVPPPPHTLVALPLLWPSPCCQLQPHLSPRPDQCGPAHLLPLPGPLPSSPAWLILFRPPRLPKAGLGLGPSGKTPSPEGAVKRKLSAAVFPLTGLWLPGDTAGSWLTISVLYSDVCIHTSTTCVHVRVSHAGPRPVSWVLL